MVLFVGQGLRLVLALWRPNSNAAEATQTESGGNHLMLPMKPNRWVGDAELINGP
jgi:hypothetical protein